MKPNKIVSSEFLETCGLVADTTGGVLPGVTVEARSPSIIEGVRTAITDGNGQYLIIALEPGTYAITYSLPGFGTLIRDGIALSTGFTATIDVQLSVGDIQETVTVSGASPVVDIQNVEQRQVMDREIIDSVPTGKSFQNYALLGPGMGSSESYLTPLSQDQGGMAPTTLSRMKIHGGSELDQQLEINGMDVGDSLTQGSNYSVFPDSNFEELSIEYSGNSAAIETGGVRINMIPREGSNQFSGHFFTTFAFPELNADNVDQELIDAGLTKGTFVDQVWTINPVLGGPIIQDKLWFFLGHTTGKADLIPANLFFAQDPSALVYVPDQNQPSLDDTTIHEQNINLTFQASTKDKLKFYWTNSATDKGHELQGRTLPTIFIAPEAAIQGVIRTNSYQATWTRPHTNRLLFEAGVSHQPVRYRLLPTDEATGQGLTSLPGVLEFVPVLASRNMSSWFSGATERNNPKYTNFVRGSVSYVTGSHNLKFGVSSLFLGENTINGSDNDWVNVNTIFGNPLRANFRTPGIGLNDSRSLGIYAQEQWTLDRMTINAGLRFDHITASFPDQISAASTWAPQDFLIEGQTATSWQDLQPRLGIAYDLFGDGRTAVKFSANRAGQRDQTDWAVALNPGQNNTLQTRSWNDGATCLDPAVCVPGDGFPQGDPLNPAANGELLTPTSNPAFGLPIVTTFFDDNWSTGWGNRFSNWEFTVSVQQELVAGMSIDVGFFRRAFGNFDANDNRALGPEDFDSVQVQIPDDPRLPTAGQMITLFDQTPGSITRLPDRIRTSADVYGGESRTWQGFDITADARVEGFLFQGGLSTGSFSSDNCEQLNNLPENVPNTSGSTVRAPIDFCNTSQNWLTQVKFLTSYTLPYDIQLAATLQNQEGPQRIAQVTYSAATFGALLGRPATGGNQVVNVLEPGTLYGDRFTQFDLRFTKIFNLANGTRFRAMFDLFNLFNSNSVVRESTGFGDSWLTPQSIMPGQLGKFAFQFDF